MRRRRSSSFSSSSFDTITNATATDAAPANNAEAPSKDTKGDAADGTAVADGLVNSLAAAADGGGVGDSQGKAVAEFRLYGSDHTTNNADTGQCEAGEERAKGERAGALFFLRQERRVRLRTALFLFLFLFFINITQHTSVTAIDNGPMHSSGIGCAHFVRK